MLKEALLRQRTLGPALQTHSVQLSKLWSRKTLSTVSASSTLMRRGQAARAAQGDSADAGDATADALPADTDAASGVSAAGAASAERFSAAAAGDEDRFTPAGTHGKCITLLSNGMYKGRITNIRPNPFISISDHVDAKYCAVLVIPQKEKSNKRQGNLYEVKNLELVP